MQDLSRETHRKVIEILIAIITSAALLSTAIACVAISFGAWKDPERIADIQSVVRTLAGALGGFILAVGLQLFVIDRRSIRANAALEAAKQEIAALGRLITPQVDGALKYRRELEQWPLGLSDCKSLYINGMSLRSFTNEHLQSIEGIAARNGKCKILFLRPRSNASAVVAKHFIKTESPSKYDNEIIQSIERLSRLVERWADRIEVRTLDNVPTSSIALIDAKSPTAKMVVEIYTYDESSAYRPHLSLAPNVSPIWYNYFERQFERLWDESEAWSFKRMGG
ncbi:hypothetical protein LO763_15565 [Glycomyces sp. A-F 0318]|uniref:hypothetical protein n=1 Tax=Glycomyces amatae TaxID=2881355 RepID=UPI001E4E1FE5|nr:hypothetical protein [Glycomyces amatae]MCD0445034.1 hypothetical protein [Glycomyces amatae]